MKDADRSHADERHEGRYFGAGIHSSLELRIECIDEVGRDDDHRGNAPDALEIEQLLGFYGLCSASTGLELRPQHLRCQEWINP